MSKATCRLAAACALLALPSLLVSAPEPENLQWGTVKGRVVFNPAVVPANPPVVLPRGMAACGAKGPILKDELVVHPKNKGVRWTLVWLTGVDDPKCTRPIPIHPSLAKMEKSDHTGFWEAAIRRR